MFEDPWSQGRSPIWEAIFRLLFPPDKSEQDPRTIPYPEDVLPAEQSASPPKVVDEHED